MRSIIKVVVESFFLVALMVLPACTGVSKYDNGNVEDFRNKRMAAVLGGCTTYRDSYLFRSEARQNCVVVFENQKGEKFIFDKYNDIRFVPQGRYHLAEYRSVELPNFSYYQNPDSILIFEEVEVKLGDVLYMGHIEIDPRKTSSAVAALKIVKKSDFAKSYLKAKYPDLADKMQAKPLQLSKEALLAKKINDILDEEREKNAKK